MTLSANGAFDYVARAGFTGVDAFAYYAADTLQTSSVARVKLGSTAPSGSSGRAHVSLNIESPDGMRPVR